MTVEADVQRLVYAEARLLDEWKLDDWLGLYAKDAVYWLPIDEAADPATASSIVHETRDILAIRVEQLMREKRHSQTPRSEILRNIGNLDIEPGADTTAVARFNLLAVEVRAGDWRQYGLGGKRLFAGRCRLEARREAGGWKIAKKTIVLLDRRQPIEGLSFIL